MFYIIRLLLYFCLFGFPLLSEIWYLDGQEKHKNGKTIYIGILSHIVVHNRREFSIGENRGAQPINVAYKGSISLKALILHVIGFFFFLIYVIYLVLSIETDIFISPAFSICYISIYAALILSIMVNIIIVDKKIK